MAGGGLGVGAGLAGSRTRGQTQNASILAQRLAPPHNAAPQIRVYMVGLIIVLAIGAQFAAEPAYRFAGIAVVTGCAAMAYWLHVMAKAADIEFQAKFKIWNRLYYCQRCDSAMDPATRQIVPAERTSSLLRL